MTPAEQDRFLRRNVVEALPVGELLQRLEAGRPLRVKLGVDPTAPDIHLGHTVALSKLREFQDLGHVAVVIIGDFTARVGDPSGRSATRPQLSAEEIERNAATYLDQMFRVLRRDGTEIRHNSEWFGPMSLTDVLSLAAQATVARMLERDDFQRRYREGSPIGLHEFLYPLMQGYDSVMVRSDVEIGGTDQTFNLLVGRDLQRAAGQPGQVTLALPLLEGLDGSHKMSKSLGNHVGIAEAPEEMFGKLMSISDALMARYYALLCGQVGEEAQRAIAEGSIHPMEAKKALARELVGRFHGAEAAERAAGFFTERFQKRADHAPRAIDLPTDAAEVWICQVLKEIGFAASTSEARRLVAQGAVRVDGAPVGVEFRFRGGRDRLLAVGRRRLAEIRFVDRARS